MLQIPERIQLANLPTRIEKLERLSKTLGENGPMIHIKRDDQTGTEVSGNKIRKLEYSIKEALDQGCDCLITCGGIQSNHARATAAAAARLGLASCLVLRGTGEEDVDGNLFLDKLFGAEVRFITREQYRDQRLEIMKQIAEEKQKLGFKAYIIPEGASNGIGTFGYFGAMQEILEQQKVLGVEYDAIVVATGSGGTYAGLYLANRLLGGKAHVYGVNVCDDAAYFKKRIKEILEESKTYLKEETTVDEADIRIIDGYVGRGYALSRPEELEFVQKLASLEGIVLDPVYTGKAMYGLTQEFSKGRLREYKNILFIHTGGLFGLFPQKNQFEL